MAVFVIINREEVRDVIIPTPTPEPTRSATEYALLADLSERDGELAEAAEYYQEAIRLDATKPEFFIRLISLLVQTADPERALEVADQATILAPDDDAVWTAVAAAYLANGDRLSALGDITGASLQYAQAVQAADKATDLNPENATALAYKAGGLVSPGDPEKYGRAQEAADRAVFLEPANSIARYYLATVFDNQGFYSAAREQYLDGLQSDSSFVDLHLGLAYNYFGTGNLPEAILSFESALDVDPDNAAAYDGLAYMYLQLGEDVLAQENATRAVELDPNMARAHGRLGQAYFRQNNYEEAINALEIAVNLYGTATDLNARFFYMLAASYIRDNLNSCPTAVPLFEQVAERITAFQDLALEGIEECRRAALDTTP